MPLHSTLALQVSSGWTICIYNGVLISGTDMLAKEKL